jgi:hypothetical protein
MKAKEMNRVLKEELDHIPREYGNLPQNMLRAVYNSTRRYGLKLGEGKEKALARSIEALKKDYPAWRPSYDREYFRLSDN